MTQEERPVRTIKRYSNRKLYDLAESRYVTLQDIAAFLQEGIEVRIVDNKTSKDITSVTMAQVLLEQERKRTGGLPLNMLRNIITSSGELIQKKLTTPVMAMAGEAEKNLLSLRDETEKRMAFIRRQAEKKLYRLLKNSKGVGEEARSAFLEITHSTQVALDDISRQFDEKVKALVGLVHSEEHDTSGAADLSIRLERLEAANRALTDRVAKLESSLSKN